MPARCRRSCARVKGWYEVLLIGLRGRSWRGTGKGYRPLSVAPRGGGDEANVLWVPRSVATHDLVPMLCMGMPITTLCVARHTAGA